MANWINISISVDDTTPDEVQVIVADQVDTKTFDVTEASDGSLVTTPSLTSSELYQTTGAEVTTALEQACQAILKSLQYKSLQQTPNQAAGHNIWDVQNIDLNVPILVQGDNAPVEQFLYLTLTVLTAGPYTVGQNIDIEVVINNESIYDLTSIGFSVLDYSGSTVVPIMSDVLSNTTGTYTISIEYIEPAEYYLSLTGTINGISQQYAAEFFTV